MAEHFRFFDAQLNDLNQPDREYNAGEFTDYFKALVTTGLMKGAGNQLAVTTSGSNMIATIDTGIAFILGKYYENDSLLSHTHDTETLGRDRIDRVVIRLDANTDARYVKSFIKKGVASASPVAPTLTQTPTVYEISLAQVKVIGGQTFISSADIVDERGRDVICPYAGSNILPNFDSSGLADLIAKVDNTVNAIAVYGASSLDPNTTTDPLVITSHANGPFAGQFAYIRTLFYTDRVSNRAQTAVSYSGTPRMAVRRLSGGVWSPWEHVVTASLPAWTPATLAVGWVDRPAHLNAEPLRYYKDSFGVVHLSGMVDSNTSRTNLITTLPVGYRPGKMIIDFGVISDATNNLTIDTNGQITCSNAPIGNIVAIRVSFRTD